MSSIDIRPTPWTVIAKQRAEDQPHRSAHSCRRLRAAYAVSLSGKALLGEIRQDPSERITRLGGKLAELTLSVQPAEGPKRSLLKPVLWVLAE